MAVCDEPLAPNRQRGLFPSLPGGSVLGAGAPRGEADSGRPCSPLSAAGGTEARDAGCGRRGGGRTAAVHLWAVHGGRALRAFATRASEVAPGPAPAAEGRRAGPGPQSLVPSPVRPGRSWSPRGQTLFRDRRWAAARGARFPLCGGAETAQYGAAEETQHILKVLRSHETPFVKKRQVMNHVFGDYHLNMAEDQMSMEKADVKPGDVEAQQSNEQASDGVVYGKQSDQISEAKPEWFMSSDDSFRFDFTLSEIDPEATGTSLEAVAGVSGAEQIQTNVRATAQENWNGALSFAASGQEPKFAVNFAIPDEDCPLVPASQHVERTADHEVLGNSLPTESAGMLQISALQKPELTQTAGSAPKEHRSCVTLKIPQPETAPGGETVIAKSTADGAAQKKKKKKKQKTSVSKKEIEETEVNRKAKAEANGCQNKNTSHQDETSQQSDDQLWKEVNWCVEQLELGLKTQKSTPKQAEEALRAIKTLRNDKAPLVKKRQLMRALFGDYRKKMEEERCKELKLMETAVKSARVVEVKGNIRNKNCQFIRKRSGACRKSQGSEESPSESPRTLNTGSFKFTTSQEEFLFNFF